jgi:hypothetical protein
MLSAMLCALQLANAASERCGWMGSKTGAVAAGQVSMALSDLDAAEDDRSFQRQSERVLAVLGELEADAALREVLLAQSRSGGLPSAVTATRALARRFDALAVAQALVAMESRPLIDFSAHVPLIDDLRRSPNWRAEMDLPEGMRACVKQGVLPSQHIAILKALCSMKIASRIGRDFVVMVFGHPRMHADPQVWSAVSLFTLELLDRFAVCTEKEDRRTARIAVARFELEAVSMDSALPLESLFRSVDCLAREGVVDDSRAAGLLDAVEQVWRRWLEHVPRRHDAYREARRHKLVLADLCSHGEPSVLRTWPAFLRHARQLDEFIEEDPAKKGVLARLLRSTHGSEPIAEELVREAKTWIVTAPSGYVEMLRGRAEASGIEHRVTLEEILHCRRAN